MTKSIKIIIIVLGLLTVGAGIFAFFKGTTGPAIGFAIFMGLSLIGTAVFSKTITEN